MGKKIFAMVLVLALSLSLCACGAETNASIETTEIVETDVSGTYELVSFPNSSTGEIATITLHDDENATYDSSDFGRGTYKATNSTIELYYMNQGDATVLNKCGDYYYLPSPSTTFAKDTDYGLPISFSEDGKSNQTLKCNGIIGNTSGRDMTLKFNEDGTFSLHELRAVPGDYITLKFEYSYEGTYTLDNQILTFNATTNSKNDPKVTLTFLYVDGMIYTEVYQKCG